MIKINGRVYNWEETDYLIGNLISDGNLAKVGDEYFWTEKSLKKAIRGLIRLHRCINNPLWKLYYGAVGNV